MEDYLVQDMIRTVICTNHWVLSLHEIFILWVSDKSLIIN